MTERDQSWQPFGEQLADDESSDLVVACESCDGTGVTFENGRQSLCWCIGMYLTSGGEQR